MLMKLFNSVFNGTIMLVTGIFFTILLMPLQTYSQTHFNHNDIDTDVTDRLHHNDAEYAMTTREGSVELLVSHDAVLIQFTDHFLDNLADEIRDEDEHYDYEEASVLADVIKSMVTSGVRKLLDHALAIPMYEIRKVYYDDGRLYIIDRDGEEIFEDLEIDDVDVMEDFSRRDARQFVSVVERRMY